MFYRDKNRLPGVTFAELLVRICSQIVAESTPIRSSTMCTHAPTLISYIQQSYMYMAKASDIGTSSIKKCILLDISTRFS